MLDFERRRYGASILLALTSACFDPATQTSSASADGESTAATSLTAGDGSGTTTGAGSASTTVAGDDSTTAPAEETGFIFDVGNQQGSSDSGDTGTDTGWDGPGSCRQSEVYGAAGGYPAFTDPAYSDFLDKQVLVMTTHTYQPSEFALRVIDISGDPPPPNAWYNAPIYTHDTWHEAAFGGGIFGLTLDSYGNIYIAASTVYGSTTTPGTIYKVDKDTAAISVFATLPNTGPAFGNINYDCNSETIRVVSHEDCRIWQLDMGGNVVSTYHHATGDVTMGEAADPGEPNGQFCPLGERMWAVQAHYGRVYYSVWWEDSGRQDAVHENEIWSVGVDDDGVPDGGDAVLEATIPGLNGASYSNPVSDLSFAQSGWMLAAERTMYGDNQTVAHQSTTYELQQMMGTWQVVGTTYVVGELPNSSAGGVDHDFAADGYVWMTGDALDFYTPDVVYGVQGTPYGGGDITNSTLIDADSQVVDQDKGALGDCEIPIPGDAEPPPPPPEG
ncbi:MAG TPA: hypothetical protein VG755_05910 [Nannocystaceae bacterium]|nr:hypothetical protein [Nannocystaceae bacterium]